MPDACVRSVRLFTLPAVVRKAGRGLESRVLGVVLCTFVAGAVTAGGCGVKTVYLHDGKQQLDNVAVVVWSSVDPPGDAPSIALAKIDDKKLDARAAPVNRVEVMPGTHDFFMKASYPDANALGAHKPPPKAQKTEGPAKFSLKGVSLSPGACYVVASDVLGDAWTEPVIRDARPTDPGFKFCSKR
jgi:hypothetical protein